MADDLASVQQLTPDQIEVSNILHPSACLWHINPEIVVCNVVYKSEGDADPRFPSTLGGTVSDEEENCFGLQYNQRGRRRRERPVVIMKMIRVIFIDVINDSSTS